MAIWPFGKKDDKPAEQDAAQPAAEYGDGLAEELGSETGPADTPGDAAAAQSAVRAEDIPAHDAIEGDSGPFDGDSVDINEFDFTDFSNGLLNLGSIVIPLPKLSQVQVEMGEQGPRMVHIVTEFGRVTPVAFAAPRSAGQWAESINSINEGMTRDGLSVEIEQGPWGPEVVGSGEHGAIRVVGVDGPRWMLRMTATAPADKVDGLRDLVREITARTFVYRGDNPILAGNSLPVALPEPLVNQVKTAMEQRAQQMAQQPNPNDQNLNPNNQNPPQAGA